MPAAASFILSFVLGICALLLLLSASVPAVTQLRDKIFHRIQHSSDVESTGHLKWLPSTKPFGRNEVEIQEVENSGADVEIVRDSWDAFT